MALPGYPEKLPSTPRAAPAWQAGSKHIPDGTRCTYPEINVKPNPPDPPRFTRRVTVLEPSADV
jgi:hypothetical protein